MTYKEFCNLINKENDFIWIHSKDMDIGGGVLKIADIDKLQDYDSIDKVMISGLRQNTFEYFISNYGCKIKYIKFFKNKLIEDLTILSSLENVVYIDFFHNQRVTELWNMTKNKNLIGLSIDDFSRLHSLKGIETAQSLNFFHFGDKVWSKSRLTDLEPLLMTSLIGFSFGGKSIENNDIMLLSKIKTLKYFDCASNFYTTEEIAKLVAASPYLKGYALRPFIEFDKNDSTFANVLICGKRKPFLYSDKDKKKIQKYTEEFNKLVEYYKSHG